MSIFRGDPSLKAKYLNFIALLVQQSCNKMFSLNQFFHAIKYALHVTNYENIFLKVKQYQILESVLLKRDTIGILATGYGKSVIFNLIPFAADYLCKNRKNEDGNIVLIITPLNAIIDDQISILQKHGIKAAMLRADTITSTTNESDTEEIEDEVETVSVGNFEENIALTDLKLNDDTTTLSIQEGKFKIIYSHPEAFVSCKEGRRLLMSSVLQRNVFACVIDEAHLVKEWGLDFRKDFSKLSQLGSLSPEAPFLVLTATAPKHLQQELTKSLLLNNPQVIVANLDRPNIFVHKCKRLPASSGEESFRSILPIVNELKKKLKHYPLTLIYLPLKWCGYAFKMFLEEMGEKSYLPIGDRRPENCLFAQFHAPQTQSMKDEILRQLQGPDECRSIRVVFATIAIGIGVNISDIRHVVHVSVPGTLESLYQEIGRAGRDGKPAKSSIYYNGHDISSNKPGMTHEMRRFCTDDQQCLRKIILDYLGSPSYTRLVAHSCCNNCAKNCNCSSCQVQMNDTTADIVTSTGKEDDLPALRSVSYEQRVEIRRLMRQYRLQLGQRGRHIGGIETRTGVTLQLIELIIQKCEHIKSASDMFTNFEIWDHAACTISL